MNSFLYTFVTDTGVKRLTLADFEKDEEVFLAVRNPDNTRLFLGLLVISVSPEFISRQPGLVDKYKAALEDQAQNPLKYYAPNSQEQLDFINDDEHTVSASVDPNRVGKSSAAWIKVCVSDPPLFPCDPEWPIFKDHGVKYREYRGPISVGVASYNTAKLEDPVWKELIRKWTPNWELGQYSRNGGKFSPSFGHDRLTRLECGSTIGYYTYEMDQGNYEGGAIHKWLWDEQGREAMFDGADRGTRTTNGKHYFALTPHTVEGRPDTGGAGWLSKFLDGRRTKGHKVKTYTSGSINDVPDWIYTRENKEIEFEKWEREPSRPETFDAKILAEGRARLYGEWHKMGGMVLDEWDPRVHWIEPLWPAPPPGMTLYRGIDHGLRQPTVCLGLAVDQNLNIFLYRENYTTGKQISQVVEKIIKEWGNIREPLKKWSDPKSGIVMPRYQEKFDREWVKFTALDSRSFALPEKLTGKTYGWLYDSAGLKGLKPASGKSHDHWVPTVNQYLLNTKLVASGELEPGVEPCLYVFKNCPNFKREIEGWTYEIPKRASDKISSKPSDKDDHGPQALGYAVQIPLRWSGGHHPSHKKKFDRKPGPGYWDDPNDKPNKHKPKPARAHRYRRLT